MSKKRENTTFKTSLLNDCTNHLSFQIDGNKSKKDCSKKGVNSTYETPLKDVVTPEFIRGYN